MELYEDLKIKNLNFMGGNKYKLFTNFIKKMYPDHKKILDVGSGFGTTSVLLSKLGYDVSTIDSFSTKEILKFMEYNINSINGYFDFNTDISCYDLITGLHCCQAIEKVIISSLENDKEFVVTLCETRHDLLYNKNIETREQYINYLMGLDKNIKIENLPIYADGECWGQTLYLKK